MRKQIVAGNWKMNNDLTESKNLAKQVAEKIKKGKIKNTKVIIAPTFVSLASAVKATKNSRVKVAHRICILKKVALLQEKYLQKC